MNLAFILTKDDTSYLPYLKKYVSSATSTYVLTEEITTITELVLYCTKRKVTGVFCNQPALLKKLAGKDGQKAPSIDNYAGSYFLQNGIEIVFINPLEHIFSVPYGGFLLAKYISKLTAPQDWPNETNFTWEIANENNLQSLYDLFLSCTAIAEDIETFKENLAIRCVGFCGIWYNDGAFRTHCIVIPCTSEFYLSWIRKFNDLQIGKIFQNGKYDCAYLSRYDAAPHSWFWDTAHMFHSWYSELPKDLGFLNAFFVRTARYWKDDSNTNDLEEYYLYNAKDLWATANVFLAWMLQAPQWAKDNYLQEFPLVFPCHLVEMLGMGRDLDVFTKVFKQKEIELEEDYSKLRTMVSTPTFNTNSSPQIKSLLTILGCRDLPSGDAKNLAKAKLRHPLNSRIIDKVVSIRKTRKLISGYGKDGITYRERVLYNLNPHGTDSARLASRESHFWCGLQIQNIPRGDSVKQFFKADDGFLFFEADYAQNEARGVAYLSGDKNLLENVESGRDFHATNVERFFGVAYEKVYNDATGKTLDKALRDLSKRVNHGANYNMGPGVLIDTMGEDKIYEAAILLKLREKQPHKSWGLVEIASELLASFHRAYPEISKSLYPYIFNEISTTTLAKSPKVPMVEWVDSWGMYMLTDLELSWTRKFFSKLEGNKHAQNSAIAHKPQNLAALQLNRAWMKLFYNVWMPNSDNFKLNAQIHDSVLGQYRIGHEHLLEQVKEEMRIPIRITDVKGVERTMIVPVDIKKGGKYWSECE